MKIRSLLLGSVAAAGLSTGGAFAADLGVLTSLDVCDALGLSGLTISSDTNCLQITGEVKYKFTWGDYQDAVVVGTAAGNLGLGVVGGHAPLYALGVPNPAGSPSANADDRQDWQSRFDAWIKFVATADSDFGPAKAVLKLKQVQNRKVTNEYPAGTVDNNQNGYYDTYVKNPVDLLAPFGSDIGTGIGSSDTGGVVLDEAYVSIGDSTVIMAGKKGSIMNKGDDEPLTWLDLFNSEKVDRGVSWGPFATDKGIGDGGHVIQVTSDLGNGFTVSGGLEKLDGTNALGMGGTAVGVLAYAGEGISAHITGAAAGILDAEVNAWGIHSGFAGTFDNFKVILAGAYGHSTDFYGAGLDYDYWNVLASASATFDMFTIAGAVEAIDAGNGAGTDYGASGSIGVTVAEGVAINLGARWYHDADGNGLGVESDAYQVALGVSAAVTETITVTGEVGYIADDNTNPPVLVPVPPAIYPTPAKAADDVFYASAKLAWAPGGGYTSSIKGTIGSGSASDDLGYKIETEFKKTFE